MLPLERPFEPLRQRFAALHMLFAVPVPWLLVCPKNDQQCQAVTGERFDTLFQHIACKLLGWLMADQLGNAVKLVEKFLQETPLQNPLQYLLLRWQQGFLELIFQQMQPRLSLRKILEVQAFFPKHHDPKISN